jgi:hypothetical protein
VLDESPVVPDGPDREVCTVDTLDFDPVPGPPDVPEAERVWLQRGTTVIVTTECSGLEAGDGVVP